jgi:hypothetical protein
MLNVNIECRYPECRYPECRYPECRGATDTSGVRDPLCAIISREQHRPLKALTYEDELQGKGILLERLSSNRHADEQLVIASYC